MLKSFGETVRADREVALIASALDGRVLAVMAEDFRDDVEVVTRACLRDVGCFRYASAKLRGDKAFVLKLMRESGENCGRGYARHHLAVLLQDALPTLQDDREVVRAAIWASGGEALRYASERLRDDAGMVMDAISRGAGLRHAFARLRGDAEAVRAAVRKDWRNLGSAFPALRDDGEIVRLAVSKSYHALDLASQRLKVDRDMLDLVLRRRKCGRVPMFVIKARAQENRARPARKRTVRDGF